MSQTGIPYLFMRGGTSRGPYFRREDLPEDRETLARVLVSAVGSGHALNIDGIGGGAAVTTKVAMLSRSEDGWADIDYFFAQVSVSFPGSRREARNFTVSRTFASSMPPLAKCQAIQKRVLSWQPVSKLMSGGSAKPSSLVQLPMISTSHPGHLASGALSGARCHW